MVLNVGNTFQGMDAMRRTLYFSTVMLLGLLVLAGCKEKEEEPVKPVAPPPPSATQIYGELKNAINVLWKPYNGGGGLTDADRAAAVNNLRPLLSTHRNSVNGPEAIGRLRSDVTDLIRKASADDRQGIVYGAILVYEVMEPGSNRYDKRKQRALDVLNRPKVTCNGFIETDGVLHANLEVYDKELKVKENYFVAEGDLFHHDKLQLVKVIGNNSSVQLKYLKTDDTWVVPGPKERRRRGM